MITKDEVVNNERIYENVVKQIQQMLKPIYGYEEFYDFFGGIDSIENNIIQITVGNQNFAYLITEDYIVCQINLID